MTASAPFMAWETTARSVASPWTTWRLGLVRVRVSADRASAVTLVASGDCLLDQLNAGGAGGAQDGEVHGLLLSFLEDV